MENVNIHFYFVALVFCEQLPDAALNNFFITKGQSFIYHIMHVRHSSDRNCFPGEIDQSSVCSGRDEPREKADGEKGSQAYDQW